MNTQCARSRGIQHGTVLPIALIVMAAMTLTGAALVRSVDTTVAAASNLAFRQASIEPANAGIEDAIAQMYENNAIPDRDSDLPARGYFASRQPGEDARGIPLALSGISAYPQSAPVIDAGNGNSVRYVVERLCTGAGPASTVHCNMATPHLPRGSSSDAAPAPPMAVFRVTARVDGPQNTVSHVQVMLRDGAPPKRMSWRILGE